MYYFYIFLTRYISNKNIKAKLKKSLTFDNINIGRLKRLPTEPLHNIILHLMTLIDEILE